jgi:hypothetical protein
MLIYSLLLFKVLPKFLQSKWRYLFTFGTSFFVTGLGIVLLLWYKEQGFESIYVATPFQNNLIVVFCIVIFYCFGHLHQNMDYNSNTIVYLTRVSCK